MLLAGKNATLWNSHSYHFVHLHEFLVLLVQLIIFDFQHHFKTFQLLLQIESLGVLLKEHKKMKRSFPFSLLHKHHSALCKVVYIIHNEFSCVQ